MKTGEEESEEHAAMSSNKVVFRTTRFLAIATCGRLKKRKPSMGSTCG
jgi:hypothetical protein